MGKVRNHHFYVCSHTHWDREWYGTFEDFRMRLVELTDELLEYLEDEPDYRCFNFDGQTSVIRDYLEIRPERREDIRKFVCEGRLAIGPWYVLPDEFLVSGEALVHNLRLGHKIASEFGRVAKVGYLPDSFGQISQMPQILLGFGIDTYMFWRGFAPEEDRPEFIVEGPDGSRVLGYHFSGEGYADLALFAHQAPPEVRAMLKSERGRLEMTPQAKFQTLVHVARRAVERDRSKVHVLMNGFDHMRIHKDLPELLRRANDECEGWTFHHATFEEFFEALKAQGGKWPVARTPMRDTIRDPRSCGYILAGVLSSRIYLKQANCRCQTLLERWVGPWESLKWLEFGRYEGAFLERAWELLLQNHPHDSICGCSVDGVHRDMEGRFARCEQIGRLMLRRTQAAFARRVEASFADSHEGVLVVFNPQARRVSQLVEANLRMDAREVRLHDAGPDEQGAPLDFAIGATARDVARFVRGVRLFDHKGEEVGLSLDSIHVEMTNEPHFSSDPTQVLRNRLVAKVRFWADDLPALGYRAYRFHFLGRPTARRGGLIVAPNVMENEHVRVVVFPDGSIGVGRKDDEMPTRPTIYFEDGADCGDSYDFARPLGDRAITSLGGAAHIEIVEDSPAAAAFEIRQRLEVPDCFDFEKRVRSDRSVALDLTTRVTLGARARYVVFRTKVCNRARDHRLRVVFRPHPALDNQTVSVWAEGPFDVVQWPIEPPLPDPANWGEDQPSTIPQASFVDLSDGRSGLAVFNKGLPECEPVRGVEPRIYLTLFRSFGCVSRDDLPSRGRTICVALPTPEGQCLREMEFEYAVYPHEGRWEEADVLALAHEFVAGLSAVSIEPDAGDLPPEKEFVRMEGDRGVALSTIERSQDAEGLIVRMWNGTTERREARLVFDRALRTAHQVRLDETVEKPLKIVRRCEIPVVLGPKKIVSVKVVFSGRDEAAG